MDALTAIPVCHASQQRALDAMEEAILFIRNLPEWVQLDTVRVLFLHHSEPDISFQVPDETFARLFAGQELSIYAYGSDSGPMANAKLDGFEFYSGVPSATQNGPYVMPAIESQGAK